MTYKLRFLPAALKEWKKLGGPVQAQFKKKLAERLESPRVPSDKLSGYDSIYRMKLCSAGYRLACEVVDAELLVYVITVGKREKGEVYASLKKRT